MNNAANEYEKRQSLFSFLGMIGCLLLAVQLNFQYAFSSELTADDNDPVSLAVRINGAARSTAREQVPVVQEAGNLYVPAVFPTPYITAYVYQLACVTAAQLFLRGPPRF